MPSFDHRDPVPDDLVCIFFEDTSYPLNGDSEFASSRLATVIQSETGLELDEVDIAPGYSLPAWLAEIDPNSVITGGLLIGAFFQGKNILKNLDAWAQLASRLKALIFRKVFLNRTAAASLALDELLAQLDFDPQSEVSLISYTAYDRRYQWNEGQISNEANVRVEYQAFVIHAFEFKVDEGVYLVVVDGKDVAVRHQDADANTT